MNVKIVLFFVDANSLRRLKKKEEKNIFCFIIRKILIQATVIRQYGAHLKNQIVG